jgi:hypothetical protein
MTDDHRITSGSYGQPAAGQLLRDDFAGVLYELLPLEPAADDPEPGYVQPEDMGHAQQHCRFLAAVYPGEMIEQLATDVADALGAAGGAGAAGGRLLCAASLLCREEAARTERINDVAVFGSAAWTSLHLQAAVPSTIWADTQELLGANR